MEYVHNAMMVGIQIQIIKWNVFNVKQLIIVMHVLQYKENVQNVNHLMDQIQMGIVFYVLIHNIGKMVFVNKMWKDVLIN